jgi:hypothetical protein
MFMLNLIHRGQLLDRRFIMEKRYQFSTQEEYDSILAQNSNWFVTKEEYLLEGNYVTLSDTPLPAVIYTNVSKDYLQILEDRNVQLGQENANLQQAIDDLTLQLGDALLGGAI